MRRPRRKLRASKRPLYAWRDHHRWVPNVLQRAIGIVGRFKDNPNIIPRLGYREGMKTMYAPFRYAHSVVLMFLLAHLDVLTMRVGRYDDAGKFEPYTMNQFLVRTGLGLRRIQRVGKGLRDRLKVLRIFPRAEQLESGAYVGYAWARRITVDLFKSLGLYDKLVTAREEAYQRQKGVPYREVLAAEGVVILDPGSEPLDPNDVARAHGMTLLELLAPPDTS